MRNIRVVFAVLSLSVVLVAGVADELQAQEKRQGWTKRLRYRRELRRELQGEIQLSGAFALYPMAVKWAEEFRKIHPKVRIDISAGGAGKGITDALAKVVDLGMVSRDIYPQELEKGAFPIAVVKDAVVPTINSNNPLIDQILATGLKQQVAQDLWIHTTARDGQYDTGTCVYPLGCLRCCRNFCCLVRSQTRGSGRNRCIRRSRSHFCGAT